MGLIYRRQWARQPAPGGRLNPAHPLTKKLVSGVSWDSISPTDLVLKTATWTNTNTATISASSVGRSAKGDGSSSYLSRTVSIDAVRPHVLLCIHEEVGASSTQASNYTIGSASASSGAYIGIFSGTGSAAKMLAQIRSTDGSANAHSCVGPDLIVGKVYASAWYVKSLVAANNILYCNGQKFSATGTDLEFSGTSTLVNEAVGTLKRSTAAVFGGNKVLFTARFVPPASEELDALLLDWTRDPWRLFEPLKPSYLFGSSTGVYTLTLDPATYSLTGSNTALLADRYLNLATGTYSLTGADASLIKALILDSASGSYTLTGSDAVVVRQALLNAGVGAYSITGADATLTYTPTGGAYTLNLESGGYSLTGSDVTFVYSGGVVTIKAGSWIRYRIIT